MKLKRASKNYLEEVFLFNVYNEANPIRGLRLFLFKALPLVSLGFDVMFKTVASLKVLA